jgi:RHS repeat-associated protein/CSLREA domain-containing protein
MEIRKLIFLPVPLFLIILFIQSGFESKSALADPAPFQNGDIIASVSAGLVQHYDKTGNLLETLDTGLGGLTTGCTFDATGNLYVTNFLANIVTKFSGPEPPHTNLGEFGSSYYFDPESILHDENGDFYIGLADGITNIHKVDASGNLLEQFEVEIEQRGADWIDLSSDQRTMFYTSEGIRILRYDVVDNVQLPDFVSSLPGSNAYALRILPDGGVLVADWQSVIRLDKDGNIVGTYDAVGDDGFFSLNLDPDGKSFWTGSITTGKLYKFDITTGGAPLLTITTNAASLGGVCIFGEITLAQPVPDDGTTSEGAEDQCIGKTYDLTQNSAGGPINTRTGTLSYSATDLTIQTSFGPLEFKRDYSSAVTQVFSQTMGYGWTDNLNSRLIFPSDPGGIQGWILFQAHTTNRYRYKDNGDGTYTPYPGLCGSLTRLNGPPISYELRDKAQSLYTFDENGKLVTQTNPEGHTLTYTYQNGRLSQVANDSGSQFLSLGYDAQDRVTSVADQTGRSVSFVYDPATGDLVSTTDVRNQTWTYSYEDPAHPHYLTRVTDPQQQVVERTEYDSQGRAVRQYNGEDELVVELAYNADGTTTVKDGLQNAETHSYDNRHTLTGQTDKVDATTSKIYDVNFHPVEITDPLTHTTRLAWSPDGNNLISVTDALSQTTSFAYDARNHLTLAISPDQTQTMFVYNTSGAIDPLTGATIYNPNWDEDVLLMEIANYVSGSAAPDANLVTRYSYTSVADAPEPPNLVRKIEAPSASTCYAYNAFGQQTHVYANCVDMDPATGSPDEDVLTSYTYDNAGRMETITDALGHTTRYVYDDGDERADEIIRNYDPAKAPYQDGLWNLATVNVYDASGRLTDTVTNAFDGDLDGNGLVEPAMTLDLNGDSTPEYRLEIDPDQPEYNLISHTNYDAAGRVIETITNYWPGQPAYDQDLYNLSTRTFYDRDGRVSATVENYNEDDLPGWGTPIAMDFDGDGEADATLEVNPDHPEYNRITRTSYDQAGRVSITTQAAWPGQASYYQPAGSEAVYNLVTATEYDAAGNVTKSVANYDPDWVDSDGDGFSVPLALDPIGSPVTVIVDPDAPDRNQITCMQYDALNRPQFVRTACVPGQADYLKAGDSLYNLVTYQAYDEMGRQIASVRNYYDPDGDGVLDLTSEYNFITRSYYDGLGRVSYNVENFTGDISSPMVPAYDPALPDRNLVTRYYYDASNRQIAVVRNYWEPAASADGTLTQSEIEAGLPDRDLVARTYYNNHGQIIQTVQNFVGDVSDPALPTFDPANPDRNLITAYQYDLLGRQIGTTIDRGTDGTQVSRTDYDASGRVIRQVANYADGVFDPLVTDEDTITSYTHDLLSRQVQVIDPAGRTHQTVYDALGRAVQSIADPGGLALTATTDYDVAGQALRLTNGAGEVTENSYDPLGRVAHSVQDPAGLALTTATDYDLLGRAITVVDAKGIATRYQYDNLGRLTTVIENFTEGLADSSWPGCLNDSDSVNVCAHYEYDDAGNRVQATLGNGSSIAYQYDALGRLACETLDPGGVGLASEYSYDAAGNQVRLTGDPGGASQRVITYTFDALGRELAVSYPDTTPDVAYTFDSFGNRKTMADGVGSWQFAYDRLNRLVSVTDPNGKLVSYAYDAAGSRSDLTLANSPLDVNYAYDGTGRLDSITDPFAANAPVDYSYDGASRVTGVDLPNGVTTSYAYDPAGRLSELLNGSGGNLSSFAFILDALGNRLNAAETLVLPGGGTAQMAATTGLPLTSADLGNEDPLPAFGPATPTHPVSDTLPLSDPSLAHPAVPPGAKGDENHLPFTQLISLQSSVNAQQLGADNSQEPMAVQGAGATFVVDSTKDDADKDLNDGVCDNGRGLCTLRAAIQQANALADTDTITFNISGSGPFTIQPRSPLPVVTDPVTIDATTQPGYTPDTPMIEVTGNRAGANVSGLVIATGNSSVRGLVINAFSYAGIELNTNGGNLIEANFIGTTTGGNAAKGNLYGILILGSSNNTVGGTVAGSRNVVSGNTSFGVYLDELASGNQVQGNYIGTDLSGFVDLGNGDTGVYIYGGDNNTIGGTLSGARNVISGNNYDGVFVGAGASGNQVQGNYIGISAAGSGALGNSADGVVLYVATNNTIGGVDQNARNVISGNFWDGIYISDLDATANFVQGNYIGTDASGGQKVGNGYSGVYIYNAPANNIGGSEAGARNVISGNGGDGILIETNGATGTLIQGNYIGTDASGMINLGNTSDGLNVNAAPNTVIGGTATGSGNLISGNQSGVYLYNNAAGAQLQGNLIGTNLTGDAPLGNTYYGIVISDAANNTIGGTTGGAGNVISGNGNYGIYMLGSGASGNQVQGNFIGTDLTGSQDVGNVLSGIAIGNGASNNMIGGTGSGVRNLISGNDETGVLISEVGTSGNIVQGNYIGTDVTGALPLGNADDGVHIQYSASSNLVGGTVNGAGNLIASNGWSGVRVTAGAFGNTVQGNTIGTDPGGTLALGNAEQGVSLNGPDNLVGGTEVGAANRIAHNTGNGVYVETGTGNTLEGNLVWGNGALGIDLDPPGITPNDTGDADSGPNNLQNFSLLTSVNSEGVSTTVEGSLNSTPNTSFRLEFFANIACDPSGNGEGESYLGSQDVVTDASGNAGFSATLPAGVSGGASVSATATDPGGNTSEFSACRESTSGGPTSVSYNWHYQYDALSRLTSACSNWEAATSTCLGDGFDYAYDGAGNLLSFSRWLGTAVETVNFVYNSANQIICLDANANSGCGDAGDVPYSYDAYGNLTSDGMKTYAYDAENHLVSVTEGASTTTYAYNGDGDRVSQTVDGVTTTYVNDIATPLTMLLAETTGTDTIYYLHGLDLVAQNDGVSSEYFAYDGLGSVRQMLDGAGNVLLAQAFDPYGNPYAGLGTDSTSFGFTGEQVDYNGLIFLRARYYQPKQGAFLQHDPWSGDENKPMSVNPWLYVSGNPVNLIDPSGFSPNCTKSDDECAKDRVNEIINAVNNGAEALFRMFEDKELLEQWGKPQGIICSGPIKLAHPQISCSIMVDEGSARRASQNSRDHTFAF